MKLFLEKNFKIFERWGLRPQTPQTAPPLQISGNAPVSITVVEFFINPASCASESVIGERNLWFYLS